MLDMWVIPSLQWEAKEGAHYTFLAGAMVNGECRRSYPYEFGYWQNDHHSPTIDDVLAVLKAEGRLLRENPTLNDFVLESGYQYELARDVYHLMKERRRQLIKLIGRYAYSQLVGC